MNFRPGRPETLKTVFGFRELSLAPTAHMNETHFFKLFWIPSRRPAKRTRCHAGKGAEPRAVPNLVVKMLMLKASGSSGHLLYCDGQDEQVTLKLQKPPDAVSMSDKLGQKAVTSCRPHPSPDKG